MNMINIKNKRFQPEFYSEDFRPLKTLNYLKIILILNIISHNKK